MEKTKTDNKTKIRKKVIISYPYGGFNGIDEFEKYFKNVLQIAQDIDSENKPIIILNNDTLKKQKDENYLEQYVNRNVKNAGRFEIEKMISSDTCVMWLRGWEKILKWSSEKCAEESINNTRVILLPGDIKIEKQNEETSFLNKLREFCKKENTEVDIYLGDYSVETDSAKELIDKHGTYPFLANWFPMFYKYLIGLNIKRPRSEFLNIKLSTLRDCMIGPRKFSYEQTISLLLQCWPRPFETKKINLGKVTDEKGFRALLGVMEQIERMERMIKLLWRDIKRKELNDKYPRNQIPSHVVDQMLDEYDHLDNKSNLIRKSSLLTIRAMLGWVEEKAV